MRLADKPAAVHDVGLVLDDRLKELHVVLRIVFQIGVLDQHHIAGGEFEPVAQRGALALIHGLVGDFELDIGKERCKLVKFPRGVVLRAVVDADDLASNALGERGFHHQADEVLNGLLLVIDRNDDGELLQPARRRR